MTNQCQLCKFLSYWYWLVYCNYSKSEIGICKRVHLCSYIYESRYRNDICKSRWVIFLKVWKRHGGVSYQVGFFQAWTKVVSLNNISLWISHLVIGFFSNLEKGGVAKINNIGLWVSCLVIVWVFGTWKKVVRLNNIGFSLSPFLVASCISRCRIGFLSDHKTIRKLLQQKGSA